MSHQILQMTPYFVSTFRDMKSRNACRDFWFLNLLAFSGYFRVKFLAIFRILPKISQENNRKMPKNQISLAYVPSWPNLGSFGVSGGSNFWKNAKIYEQILANFPIQIDENGRKWPNFDGSYLSNRLELWGKSAYFGERMGSATIYVKIMENNFLTQRPPSRLKG